MPALLTSMKTLALLAALVALAAGVGYVVLGGAGLWLAPFVVVLLTSLSARLPESVVMRLMGAVPVRHPPLERMIAVLSARAGIAPPALYLSPSLEANAMALRTSEGPGALALTRGTLAILNRHEIEAVLGHELSHLKNGDTELLGMASLLSRLIALALRVGTWLAVFGVLLGGGGTERALLLISLALLAPALVGWIGAALSRTREHAADASAAALTGRPLALASALAKIERHHRGWLGRALSPPAWLRSHPPTAERVRRLYELARYSDSAATNTSSVPWLMMAP